MPKIVKVAIVGSGLAGLTSAYLLTRGANDGDVQFDVHLFEKTSALGMDSSSISLPVPGKGQDWRVDVPMRSFQGGYYKQLIALYKRLGVGFRQADFSYSFSQLSPPSDTQRRQITAAMIYNGASGTAGVSMPSKMEDLHLRSKGHGIAIRAASKAWTTGLFLLLTFQLLLCYLRVLYLSLPIRRSRVETMTFGEWAKESIPTGTLARWTTFDAVWADFTMSVLVPLFSAVCTASENDILEHPVEEFLDYIWLTLGHHHYVADNGVRDVVSRLVSAVKQIHLSSPISAVEVDSQDPNLISLHCDAADGTKIHSGFHHLIFATEAKRAAPLLTSYAASLSPDQSTRRLAVESQIHCLKQFTYAPTIVINHTDDALLPDDPRDRRDLNLIYMDPSAVASTPSPPISPDSDDNVSPRCVHPSYTMATHIIPRPSGFPSHLPAVFQTTNPIIPPKEGRILSVATLERAVLTVKSKRALKDLHVEVGRRWWQTAGQGSSRLGRLQGAGRGSSDGGPGIWICGSFAYTGIPLLEGCVVSARTVVEQGILKSEGVVPRNPPW